MFVIIKNGGKQYKVQSGDIVKLESLGEEKGKKVSFFGENITESYKALYVRREV